MVEVVEVDEDVEVVVKIRGKSPIQPQVERIYNRWYDKTNQRYVHYMVVSGVALSQEVRK